MGIDIRDVPVEAIESLPDALRKAGFEVRIDRSVLPHPPHAVLTVVKCRRGADVQVIAWGSLNTDAGDRRIGIHQQSGWLWWVRRRRFQLQADVTRVIEAQGGYWPYPD